MSKESFEDRLKRLEEKKGRSSSSSPASRPAFNPRSSGFSSQNQPKQSHRLRNFLIRLGVLALGCGGLIYGMSNLASNEDDFSFAILVEATKLALKPGSGVTQIGARVEDTDAERLLVYTGWELRPPAVAVSDLSEVNIDQISPDFRPITKETKFGKSIALKPNETCTFRTPRPKEIVRNVRLNGGMVDTTLFAFSDYQIASALIKHIEGVTSRTEGHYKTGSVAEGRLKSVDVFLTDQSGPIYLVLQAMTGVIWNVHAANGVQLSHVALIGNNAALVTPPHGATIEAIRPSMFIQNNEFGSNDEIRPCMVVPWRKPKEHWPAWIAANGGNVRLKNQTRSYDTGYAAFNAWYSEKIGVDAATNLTAAAGASYVLSGPMPTTPIPFNSVDGKDVHFLETDYFVTSEEAFQNTHSRLLTQATGGDLALLTPDPQERNAE